VEACQRRQLMRLQQAKSSLSQRSHSPIIRGSTGCA
jgi:hypothetical protein